MGISTAVQVNKQMPGLKTRLNNQTVIPKFGEKSSASGSTSTMPTSVKSDALKELNNQTTRQTLLTGSSDPKRVGGMRTVKPFDYTMHNVEFAAGKYSSTPFAPTARSQRREEARFYEQLQRYNSFNNNVNKNNTGTDTLTLLSQLGSLTGQVVKELASAKSSNAGASASAVTKQDLTTAPSVKLGGEVANALSSLSSADSSKAIESGLKTVDSQITTKKETVDALGEEIKNDSEAKTKAEGELNTIKENIGQTKGDIRSKDAQIGAKESAIATAKAAGQDTTALETELQQLKAEKEALEKQLGELEGQRDGKETEIDNLDKAITKNTTDKSKAQTELKNLESAKTTYTKKQEKFQKDELKDLKNSYAEIEKLAQKLAKATDDTEKQELIQKYKDVAAKYNSLIDNTTVQHNYVKANEEPDVPTYAGVNEKMQNAVERDFGA